MMISYEPSLNTLKQKGMKKTDLLKGAKLSSATLAKIAHNESLSLETIGKICLFLNVKANEVVTFLLEKKTSPFLQTLKEEMMTGRKGGIYQEFQIAMTYSSNHIEGNRLSQMDTRYIFETNSLLSDGSKAISVFDVIETVNHFACIHDVIKNCLCPLTEEYIKKLHGVLKTNTANHEIGYFAIGDYKKQPNVIGGKITTPPSQVAAEMKKLLHDYSQKESHTFEEIVDFHHSFECIHPFQDGNGRVGRLILMKECLKNGFLPVIIDEEIKAFYYRGLSEYEDAPGYLIDTCKAGQDKVRLLCDYFEIPYED